MKEPHDALQFALEKYPERLEIAPLEDLVVDSARSNAKRPAYVKIALPDEIVKSLRGSADRRQEIIYLVRMPKEVAERSESNIILPGEV